MTTQQENAKKIVIERSHNLALVRIESSGIPTTWAVQAPNQLGVGRYFYSQPDEATARSFYDRLKKALGHQ